MIETLVRRVDRLCTAYATPLTYLGVVRVLFALYVLVQPISYGWMVGLPDAFFDPRPGPFVMLPGVPTQGTVVTLTVLRVMLAFLLLVGLGTRLASVGMTLVLIIGSGYLYSFGKVDHHILFELLPLFMAWAGWGDRISLDRRLRSGLQSECHHSDGLPVLLWGMTIAYGLLTAAIPKASRGLAGPRP